MIQIFLTSYLPTLLGLIAIINPLGMSPIFLRYTQGATTRMRRRLAGRVGLYGLIILSASVLGGSYILAFFGLTLSAVQIGGGIVVAMSGWRLLEQGTNAKRREERAGIHDENAPQEVELASSAFYPLTLPLTVGPGTISVAMTLGAKDISSNDPLMALAGSLSAVVSVALLIYLCFRFAEPVFRRLGETGTDIVVRLSAFILLCIGVQVAWNGIMAGLAASGS